MIPVKLSLSGFLSYREPVTLDFTGIDLACISGANGAGKSSLLDAITWALFGQARKRDESLIHTACQKAEVTLDFEYENNLYRVHRSIQRGKGNTVDFFVHNPQADKPSQVWKTLSERTLRETDALIVRTLRLDYDTFINASFFLQGKADQFATQRPAERKRILGSILGLDVWETYKDQATTQRKEKEDEVKALDARMGEVLQELSEEPARKQRLHELEGQLATLSTSRVQQAKALQELKKLEASLLEREKMLVSLFKQLEIASQYRDRNAKTLQERQSELQSYELQLEHADETETAYHKWQQSRQSLSELEIVAEKFRQSDNQRREPLMRIEAERARLAQEIANLEASLAALEKNEENLQALYPQLEALEADIQRCQSQIAQRMELEDAIRTLHQQQADARAENPRLKAEMEELRERMTRLEKTEGTECPLCGQPLSEDERQALLKKLSDEGTAKGVRYRDNQALLNEFTAKLAEMEKSLTSLKKADDTLRSVTRQQDQLKDRIHQAKSQREEWDAKAAPHLGDLKARLAVEYFMLDDRQLLKQIDAELKTLGYDAAAHERLRRFEQSGRATETAFNALGNARAALVPLRREIEGLQSQLERQNTEVESLQKAHDQAAAQLAADQTQLPDMRTAENALLDAQEAENRLRMEVGAARQKVAVLDTLRQRQVALNDERENLTRRIEQLKLLEKSFGKDGVPALLIEQALPEIEAQANVTLSRLSNNTMSVQFITQRDYKDASRDDKKETLDIRISDGSGARDYEMFSGGEAFRVNFAIRLALSRVLAQRAGARLQTLVIDEGFGNQDAQGRQRLIEAINLVKGDFARILIITHLEELKEVFPTRIEVEKTARGSTLRVI